MPTVRIRSRVNSARFVATARLTGYVLAFHKASKDGSAKCDALKTGRSTDEVIGVVYEIDDEDISVLDRYEGKGVGYDRVGVDVAPLDGGQSLPVFTYCATHIDASLRPYTWYVDHVLTGAREHTLPDDFVRAIEQTPSVEDPDRDRDARERSIYPS